MKRFGLMLLVCGACLAGISITQSTYQQVNLVSDFPGLAARRDFQLVNAWGLTFAEPSGPWWVNASGTELSILYDGTGMPAGNGLQVFIPPPGQSQPTGIVFNSTPDFTLAPGARALFMFASNDGTISGWNPAINPNTAVVMVTTPGARYTGLALGTLASGKNILYAANLARGIEEFDTNFNSLPFDPSAFQDPQLPAGYEPFNVQNLNGSLWVMFAKANNGDEVHGDGLGYVDKFTPEGKLLMRLQNGLWMNAPWGIAIAPDVFGTLSQRVLVGQFGSGRIATFDPNTGSFAGLMLGTSSSPVTIDGLWGIRFGNNGTAGSARELYFTAGPNDEMDGLFGKLVLSTKTATVAP